MRAGVVTCRRWGGGKGVCDCLEVVAAAWSGFQLVRSRSMTFEDHEQLAHGGGERELSDFTGSDQALVEAA